MNSRLELFNKQLERCAYDAQLNGVSCKVLVKDIDNKGLIETKRICVPLEVMVSVGDTISIKENKYMVLNATRNNCFSDVVVQEIYHSIKIKYSWIGLMQFDVMVQGVNQVIVDTSMMTYDDTSVYVLIQKNSTSKGVLNGTRFYLFNRVYKIETITWENGNILKCKCSIEPSNQYDDATNQIADNRQFTPPTPKYTIVSSAGMNGSISPLGEVVVEQGKSQEFAILCDEGYEIDTVLVDEVEVEVSNLSYIFSNVQANHTISVSFKEIPPIPSGSITGEAELYKGYAENYTLEGFTNPSTVWSVDVSYITISNQTNTGCTLYFNVLSDANKTFTLKALVNGSVTVTKSIATRRL